MPHAAQAQEGPATAGDAVGAGLEQVQEGIQQFSAGKATLSRTIRDAREAYWRAYLYDADDLARAEAAYEHALYLKDFSFLAWSLAGRESGAAAAALSLLNGNPLDGGIPESAAFEFAQWTDGVYTSLVRGGGSFALSPAAWEPGSWHRALQENEELYRAYREVRNETAFLGLREHTDTPRGYANAFVWDDDDCLDTDVYDGMVEALGRDHADAAIQAVREAPKDERGRVADLAALGLFKSTDAGGLGAAVPSGLTYVRSAFPAPVLRAILTRGTPEQYFHGLFHGGCQLAFDPERYDRFTRVYGEDAVRDALIRTERAPKTASAGRVINPEVFGLDGYVLPFNVFEHLLRQNPKGYTRSLISGRLQKEDGIEAPTANQISAAYDALVAEHGEATVLKAAVEIREMESVERRALGPAALVNRLRPPAPNEPSYLAWADAPEGTTATYLKTEVVNWIPPEQRETVAVRFIGVDAEGVHLRVTTTRLNADGEAEVPEQSEHTIKSWVQDATWYFPLSDLFFPDKIRRHRTFNETERQREGPRVSEDVVEVWGRRVPCRREAYDYGGGDGTVVCYSEEVPGGLVYLEATDNGELGVSVRLESFGTEAPAAVRAAEAEATANAAIEASAAAEAAAAAAASEATIEAACPGGVLVSADRQPELVDGLDGLQRRLQYPSEAKSAGIEGTVFLQFVIDPQGRVVEPVCTRDPGGGTCEEAMRLVQTATFQPGVRSGNAVCVRYSVPVKFRLR